jgi:hypothetical protein
LSGRLQVVAEEQSDSVRQIWRQESVKGLDGS